MRIDVESIIAQNALNVLLSKADIPASSMIQIQFKGYTAEDCDCKYCLHYGGKSKGCLIAKCCCHEEKQQAAAKYKEEKI